MNGDAILMGGYVLMILGAPIVLMAITILDEIQTSRRLRRSRRDRAAGR